MTIVHKFGGTSVGSVERFAAVAEIVMAQHRRTEHSPAAGTVVVVSAMSGVTNQLLSGAWACGGGADADYRRVKAELLARHLEVIEALLPNGPERLDVGGWVEDRLHELERLYRSMAVLGELTARGRDHVAAFGEQLSVHILAAVLQTLGMRAQASGRHRSDRHRRSLRRGDAP